MNPERWARLRPILEGAWNLPADEREAFVRARAGDDAQLADDALAQLAAEGDDPTFLEPPAAHAPSELHAAVDVGAQLGPWRVTRRLAQGGMGTVWEAERDDGAFTMTAAVKVLRDGLTTDTLRRRFHDERELLARLDHPSIVRLLDGGTHADVPYLVMERVDGTAIDVWCDERRLDVDARLALLLDVYDAVAFAHGALVVHRDIKPSNVLVDTDGRPRLLDFGISTTAESSDDGTLASSPLTPRYASPEQLRDEPVTTASDVFALGVLSYELLVGATPHGGGPRDPAAVAARASDVARRAPEADERARRRSTTPTSLARRLAGDLDAILARALAVDPRDRYPTVAALRDDVRRHLRHEVVTARAAGPALVTARLVRRHPVAAGAVLLAAGVLVVSTITVAKLYLDAEDARADAVLARDEAETSAALAQRRFDDVRDLASALVFDLHDEIAAIAGATRARGALVETSLRYLDALAAEADDDVELLADVGTAYRRLGDVQGASTGSNLGDVEAARAAYERLVALRERLVATTEGEARARALDGLVVARRLLVSTLERQGAFDEAFAQLDAAAADLARRRAEHGDAPHLDVVERALAIDHGDTLVHAGRLDEAAERFEATLPAARAAVEGTPPESVERVDLGALLDKLGDVYQRRNELDAAEAVLRESVALSRARHDALPDELNAERMLDASEQALADVLVSAYRVDDALDLQMTGLVRRRDRVLADPDDALARRDLHRHLGRIARGLSYADRRDESVAFHEQALDLALELLERNPDDHESRGDAAHYAAELGGELWRLGRHDESQTRSRRALQLCDEVLAVDPSDAIARHMRVAARHNLSVSSFLTGAPDACLEHATVAVTLADEIAAASPNERWPNRMRFVCRVMVGDAHLALARGADEPDTRRAHLEASIAAYDDASVRFDALDARGLLLPSDAGNKGFADDNLRAARELLAGVHEP